MVYAAAFSLRLSQYSFAVDVVAMASLYLPTAPLPVVV
jgi:hypothetical protein